MVRSVPDGEENPKFEECFQKFREHYAVHLNDHTAPYAGIMELLAELKEKYGFKLMIDGSCSPAVIEELSAMGADGFILGTSALFGKGRPYAEIIPELKGEKA